MSDKFGKSSRPSRSSSGQKTIAEIRSEVSRHRISSRYSTLWPMLIILGTLMFTTTRDLMTFRNLKRDIIRQDTAVAGQLSVSGAEVHLIDSFKDDLSKLGETDPVAARIVADFFPSSPRVNQVSSAPAANAAPGTVPTPSPATSPTPEAAPSR